VFEVGASVKEVRPVKVYEVGLGTRTGKEEVVVRRLRGLAEDAIGATEQARSKMELGECLLYAKPLFELDWE
jgi:hypothetical protein